MGFEPTTSSMPLRRAPSCAMGPSSSGPGGIRTRDLISAIDARSQLRYRPFLGDWIVLERQIHCQDKSVRTNPSIETSRPLGVVLLRNGSIVVNGGKNCYAEVRVALIIDFSDYIDAIFETCFR